jgi:acyl-CoA thioesterase-1
MFDLQLFRRSTVRASPAAVLFSILLLLGCEQAPTTAPAPPTQAPPRDGFGQRLGTDVTAQPGRGGTPAAIERPVIVAFGDSLTAGLGVSMEDSYPAQLQRRLDQAGLSYSVVNAGVSGDTTAGGVRRLAWVLRSKPVLVILELGGNDGLRGLSLAETRSNMEQIIQRLEQAGAHVVLAGMKLPPNYGADYTAQFEGLYRDLAKTYRVPLIPFFLEGVAARPSLNQADGIHPTAEGYHQVVENVMKTIEPLLRSPRPS